MRQTRGALLVVAVLGAVIVPSTAPGEENRAAARLEAMATFLAKAQRLSVTIDCEYDVVQDSGEKIEFGERRVVALRRPDHARIDGDEQLGGAATDHIAFRGHTTDAQLWIPRDGDPLPKRIVITYRLAGGQPQFEADLGAWNLAPDLPDTLFTFTPAAGAEQIPILVPRREKKP